MASDVDQAVEAASLLKQSDDAQWFRGQLADWDKLAPTFHRLVPTKANEARQKADNFATWVKQAPGLEDIASNDDKIIAVAQHYGLATTLLDFTTEPAVAGFSRPTVVRLPRV
jgi:hypothetical protein